MLVLLFSKHYCSKVSPVAAVKKIVSFFSSLTLRCPPASSCFQQQPVYTYTHTHTRMHTCRHTRTHAHTHTHTHTHTTRLKHIPKQRHTTTCRHKLFQNRLSSGLTNSPQKTKTIQHLKLHTHTKSIHPPSISQADT